MSSLRRKKNQSGFTLIELLIVVIIVAVLAAVGVPLLQGNVQRARMTEADAALGTIRTGMRAYYAEHGQYAAPVDFSVIGIKLPDTNANPPVAGDLDGRYFSQTSYILPTTGNSGSTFCAGVDGGTNNSALRASEVSTVKRSMDQVGSIYNNATCTLPAIN